MRGKACHEPVEWAERDLRGERVQARDRADRGDNGSKAPSGKKWKVPPKAKGSRACSVEVSAEPNGTNAMGLAERHIPLTTIRLIPFNGNR